MKRLSHGSVEAGPVLPYDIRGNSKRNARVTPKRQISINDGSDPAAAAAPCASVRLQGATPTTIGRHRGKEEGPWATPEKCQQIVMAFVLLRCLHWPRRRPLFIHGKLGVPQSEGVRQD